VSRFQRLLERRLGSAARAQSGAPGPAELDSRVAHASESDQLILGEARPHTLTTGVQMLALIDAVRYCVARRLEGAFAECGVWRGGSVLAMILTLQELGRADRDIHLYDTFEGMTEPTEADADAAGGEHAVAIWRRERAEGRQPWGHVFAPAVFDESSVRATLEATGYPAERLHFHRGPVERTLPAQAPNRLALLRLDTDWYESTRHELAHLFPRLVPGGVLIVDDYGHWEGARRAVDEYFAAHHPPVLLNRIDYTARIAVKH